MIENKKKILKDIDEKCYIYNILCIKSHSYYNMLSYCFNIPLVSISSVMTILNSSLKNPEILNTCNIVFNLVNAILIVINSSVKFNSKSDDFKSYQIRFIRLQYDCGKLLDRIEDNEESGKETDDINELNEKIYSLKKMYDDLTVNMLDIPAHICKKVYNNYKDDYDLSKLPPVLLSYQEKHILQKI